MPKEINLIEMEAEPVVKEKQMTLPGVMETLQIQEEKRGLNRQLRSHIKRIIEACLFASAEPLTFQKLLDITEEVQHLKPSQLRDIIEDLQEEYLSQGRAFRLYEIAEGYLLRTCEEYGRYIEKIGISKRQEKLSQPSLEVLAIIAFKGPITRPQIDQIRGVDSSGVIQNLLERTLIEPSGKLEAPGRPTLFRITPHFLKHFGLKDIQDLSKQI